MAAVPRPPSNARHPRQAQNPRNRRVAPRAAVYASKSTTSDASFNQQWEEAMLELNEQVHLESAPPHLPPESMPKDTNPREYFQDCGHLYVHSRDSEEQRSMETIRQRGPPLRSPRRSCRRHRCASSTRRRRRRPSARVVFVHAGT